MQPAIIAPAPWVLKGEGTVLVYHFSEDFSRQHGFMSEEQQRGYRGWIGAVMLVDYRESPVGPYQELLFLPGLFDVKGKLSFSVSKIYVSTYNSCWNGYQNWGLPKELADFSRARDTDGDQEFAVYVGDKLIFKACTGPAGFTFPFSSQLVPLTHLVQEQQGKWLQTHLSLSAKAAFTSLRDMVVDPEFFPPVDQIRPLGAVSLQDFSIVFSESQVLS